MNHGQPRNLLIQEAREDDWLNSFRQSDSRMLAASNTSETECNWAMSKRLKTAEKARFGARNQVSALFDAETIDQGLRY